MMIKPVIKYLQQFKDDQGEAKINNLGIWGKCKLSVCKSKKWQ